MDVMLIADGLIIANFALEVLHANVNDLVIKDLVSRRMSTAVVFTSRMSGYQSPRRQTCVNWE